MQLSTRPRAASVGLDALAAAMPLLDELGEGVVVTGSDGRAPYANPAAATLLGLTTDGPERSAAGLFAAAHRAGSDRAYPATHLPLARALAGESLTVDDLEIWRGSDRVLLEARAMPLLDAGGQVEGAVVTLLDITARIRIAEARRELHEARSRFQVAQEKAPVGLAMVSLDDRFTDVNAFLCRLCGRTRDQLVGTRMADLLHPGDAGQHGAQSAALLSEGGDDDYRERVEIVRGDGEVVSVELTAGLIEDDQGTPLHQIVLVQDVTDSLRHERVVTTLNRNLTEQATRLTRLNEDLQRSNRDLEQFAYVASHDLSEPLRSVTGYVQLLARRYRGRLDDDADEFIGFAVDGVTRMQALIQDLLAYARAGVAGAPQAVDSAAVVAAVVEAALAAHPEATADVGPLPEVVCEAAPLRQVFENLVSNAIKFVPPGRAAHISVSACQDGPAWRFTVADNGIGIDERHVERIFGMFQRLHARSEYAGTGIGLSICRRVVERLGGALSAESRVGEGTSFSFTIPVPAEAGA